MRYRLSILIYNIGAQFIPTDLSSPPKNENKLNQNNEHETKQKKKILFCRLQLLVAYYFPHVSILLRYCELEIIFFFFLSRLACAAL